MSRPAQSKTKSFPAPVGGLNTASSIAAMPELDAITLRNMIPATFGCTVRKGYIDHAIGLVGEVGTVMSWSPSSGTASNKLFAVDTEGIYDVTTPGDFADAVAIAASTASKWQHTNFANAAGTHLVAFNGINDGFWWGPAGYAPLTAGDGVANGTWAGIDPQLLIQVTTHQKRLWAVEKDSTRAWYLPPEQVFGVAKSFDFGALFSKGGYLQALATWTADSGFGPDDFLVAISSGGEAVVYKGYNPDAAEGWQLVGQYFIGQTFARRCVNKFGGDVAVLTQYGMINLNRVLRADSESLQGMVTDKIQQLLSALVAAGSFRDGWQLLSFPSNNLFIINVPGADAAQSAQLVMNTVMKAWCLFTGMNAFCWQPVHDSLLFGTTGKVCRALETNMDGVAFDGAGGSPIPWEAQQAFSYFDTPGQQKHFKMARPTFISEGLFEYAIAANMEFSFSRVPIPGGLVDTDTARWDIALWDSGALWSGSSGTFKQWHSIDGIGYAASIRLAGTASSELTWTSTDWIYEPGGAI